MINWKLKRFITKFQDVEFVEYGLSGLKFLDIYTLSLRIKQDKEFLEELMYDFENQGVNFNGKYTILDVELCDLDEEYIDYDGTLKGYFLYRTFDADYCVEQNNKRYFVTKGWNNR